MCGTDRDRTGPFAGRSQDRRTHVGGHRRRHRHRNGICQHLSRAAGRRPGRLRPGPAGQPRRWHRGGTGARRSAGHRVVRRCRPCGAGLGRAAVAGVVGWRGASCPAGTVLIYQTGVCEPWRTLAGLTAAHNRRMAEDRLSWTVPLGSVSDPPHRNHGRNDEPAVGGEAATWPPSARTDRADVRRPRRRRQPPGTVPRTPVTGTSDTEPRPLPKAVGTVDTGCPETRAVGVRPLTRRPGDRNGRGGVRSAARRVRLAPTSTAAPKGTAPAVRPDSGAALANGLLTALSSRSGAGPRRHRPPCATPSGRGAVRCPRGRARPPMTAAVDVMGEIEAADIAGRL